MDMETYIAKLEVALEMTRSRLLEIEKVVADVDYEATFGETGPAYSMGRVFAKVQSALAWSDTSRIEGVI